MEHAFLFGKNLGVAFQIIDECLDFSASSDSLGKPAGADLELGLATAPVLFAAEKATLKNITVQNSSSLTYLFFCADEGTQVI